MVTQGLKQLTNIRSVYELVEARLGLRLDFKISSAQTVGTSSETIAANNPGRTNLTIINVSTTTLYVAPVNVASSSNGIILAASGGSLSLNYNDDLIQPALQWNGVASGSGSAIFVIEAFMI